MRRFICSSAKSASATAAVRNFDRWHIILNMADSTLRRAKNTPSGRRSRDKTSGNGTGSVSDPKTGGVDLERISAAVREILIAVGEDPDREGLRKTPMRVARMYEEMFSGLTVNPHDHLKT